jgi:hypothetical protein
MARPKSAPTEPSSPLSLHMVIFSKDRACQLDCLLRSLRDHLRLPYAEATVLYRATSADFAKGYARLKSRAILDNVQWRAETLFHDDAIEILCRFADADRVMFLVDDDIMFRPLADAALFAAFSDSHLFISLRADRAYSETQPSFFANSPYLEWQWNFHKRRVVTWNYPFSLDGNVVHCRHLKRIVRKIEFSAPNSFEGRMHSYRHAWWIKRVKKALAGAEAVIFNNPLNRVQSEGETPHRDVSPGYLNQRFLDGYRIVNHHLYSTVPMAVHFPADIQFEKDG